MKPVLSVYQAMADGILAMAWATLATLGKVVPIKAAYTPGPNLALSDLTLSDFDGSTPIAQTVVPVVNRDPVNGDFFVRVKPPAGGWNWTTTGVTNLPQNVNGYALTDAGGTTLIGVTDPLTVPPVLTASGQNIDAGELIFRIPLGSVS